MNRPFTTGIFCLLICLMACQVENKPAPVLSADYPIVPVPFNQVQLLDGFWKDRVETAVSVTIPFAFAKSEETGRIHNFAVAGGLAEGAFQGIHYNDSDVFKIMEGAAYALTLAPDPQLASYLDSLVNLVAAAQEADGYLYTIRTIGGVDSKFLEDERWTWTHEQSHELYNVGHMYEAAVAHYRATGKRTFLEVAIKNADLLVNTFGPDKLETYPGHQEIEIGLCKLYRATGKREYLDLARFFLDMRGRKHIDPSSDDIRENGKYYQNHLPVTDQSEAVGHAVRAMYMYSGMADVASLAGEKAYLAAIDRIWENVTHKKLALTGGIGASRGGEAFGGDYFLPTLEAYNETCAAVGNVFFNHRMFLLHGKSDYIDVLERTLYNGLLSGMSLEGDRFFYANPLASDGTFLFNGHGDSRSATRNPWFRTSCCPSNMARLLPSLGGYIYAQKRDTLFVNLFIASEAQVELEGGPLRIRQLTDYPLSGKMRLEIDPVASGAFALCLRVPGWVSGRAVPGDLYVYQPAGGTVPAIQVNGQSQAVAINEATGYVTLQRRWNPGDIVEWDLPMSPKKVYAAPEVAGVSGQVALERGPLVYCAEGADNGGTVLNRQMASTSDIREKMLPNKLGGILQLETTGPGGDTLVWIPYYAWSHRGPNEMTVWMDEK